ncbi:hypothetical protein ACET3X_000118 [Alternaria dauci]|uniref:BTB domain-containing protein n=1 Tax=Alternaria dauci TaxID=48095 RepID=A0ABR3UWL5_9PLEO
MPPSSTLAELQKNRDRRNTLIVPVFSKRSGTESEGSRVSHFADTQDTNVPFIPDTIKIIVGPDSTNQRTWSLPKAQLSRYSHIFRSIITVDDTVSEVELPTISPNAFADFVSFMHSSIYSVNTNITGYRSVRAHTDACLLAAKLEADEYWEAGMRKLYNLFLPLAKSKRSDAKQSFIRASDIAYICVNTTEENLRGVAIINSNPPTSNDPAIPQITLTTEDSASGAPPAPPRNTYRSNDIGAMKGLRTLFFDAVASHWTHRDVIYVGAPELLRVDGNDKIDVPVDSTTWGQVYAMNPDFHLHITKTAGVLLGWRASLFKHINRYLDPVDLKFIGGPGGASSGVAGNTRKDVSDSKTEHVEDADKFKVKANEDEEDEGLEMNPLRRRPKFTLKLRGLNQSASGDGVDSSEQALSNVKSEDRKDIKSEDAAHESGENDEGIDSDRSTVVDEGEEDLMEGIEAGIGK